ncbi:MAG: cobalamin-dependent protein [Chloroflexota bacterium]|nr:cobalamin B12-binding domain-containing protein [Chloroflexota bacterium]
MSNYNNVQKQTEPTRQKSEQRAVQKEEAATQVTDRYVVDLETVIGDVVNLLVERHYAEAERQLYSVINLLSPEQFLLDLLIPIEIQLGELWQNHTIGVVTEHMASSWLRQHVESLLTKQQSYEEAPLVLCACAPGELHELGMLSLSYFLRRAKIHALYLGANLPANELVTMVANSRPVAVCLSAATTSTALRLIPLLHQLNEEKRGYAPIVGYGGRFFNLLPEAQRATLPGVYLGFHAAVGSLIVLDKLNQVNQALPLLEARVATY